MATVSVVIPTYNAIGQVEPLLNQLLPIAAANEVIITDDASPDSSAARLAELYPAFTVVAARKNVGFGANVMRGVEAATGEYLFLLNSDVELCGDPITPLVELLSSDESVFAAMPLIYNTHLGMVENLARLYCHRGLCWHTELTEQAQWTKDVREWLPLRGAGRWPANAPEGNSIISSEIAPEDEQSVSGQAVRSPRKAAISAVLCGAAFLCMRDRFLQLGGFDPRYRPFYWEDVALGFAAARHSWKCVTVPQALVIHRHSESISAKVGERKLRYLIRNQLRFVQQYRRDLHALGLKHERAWWLARGAKALVQGDLEMAHAYLGTSLT